MKSRIFVPCLATAAILLGGCNDRPTSVVPTPAPGSGATPASATPAAGSVHGDAGGRVPAEDTRTYPKTEYAK